MPGNLCTTLTSAKLSWVAAAVCHSLKHHQEALLDNSILSVAPGHTSGTDWLCFAQLTFWSLKVIHMRGVNVFSISCWAAVNSWKNDSLLELHLFHSTILPLWLQQKLPKAWEGGGNPSIPNLCGAAATLRAATTQQWLCMVRGWVAGTPGPPAEKAAVSWGFTTSLSWGPSLANGCILVNSFSTGKQQETFGIITFRAEICSQQMGRLIHSWRGGTTKGCSQA